MNLVMDDAVEVYTKKDFRRQIGKIFDIRTHAYSLSLPLSLCVCVCVSPFSHTHRSHSS